MARMSDRSKDLPNHAETVVRLKYKLRGLRVYPGEYLIGRSRNCHLIIDDDLVSRRHACLTYEEPMRLVLRDLASRNGVSVNGKRIEGDPRGLVDGDIFTIGSEELHVFVEKAELGANSNFASPCLESASHIVLKPSVATVPERTETTNDLDLIGAVAERALVAGHPRDAEKLLEMHLRSVLIDTQSHRRTTSRVRQKAFDYALRLAEATAKGEWFDYAVDLLCAEKVVCSQEQFTRLQCAAKLVPCVDTRRLKRYTAILRADARTMAGIKMASLIDVLAGQSERA
jgi:pSer/pThr/pTyr-binding forkhead associated (FHA) protein